jgi:hypothetical protein
MQRFDVSRVGRRVRRMLASPRQLGTDTRSGVLAFGAGLFVGVAIGAYLGFGPLRALAPARHTPSPPPGSIGSPTA